MAKSEVFLLDTQIFIWWMEKSDRLSKSIINLLRNPQNKIFLSVASVWEMVIKKAKQKLKLPKDIETGIKASGFEILSIEITHVLGIEKLPAFHQDPFDRMLISQSQIEKLRLISSDKKIWKYDVATLRC